MFGCVIKMFYKWWGFECFVYVIKIRNFFWNMLVVFCEFFLFCNYKLYYDVFILIVF